jgi:hypothetical protein
MSEVITVRVREKNLKKNLKKKAKKLGHKNLNEYLEISLIKLNNENN